LILGGHKIVSKNAGNEGKFEGKYSYCIQAGSGYSLRLFLMNVMNAELCRKAAEKVGNPNVLVNLISRRVRQLNAGGGGISRPLVDVPAGMGMADIALREILEEKIGWEMPELTELVRPQPKKRRKK
jgi:DNA-directed RNA polymerase subunit omega